MTLNAATPGRSKDEEKGSQILAAAGSLFMSEGFESVSMEQVAKAAGVSKQTVYSHYGNKEALFTAAIEQKCREYQVSSGETDFEQPVRDYLRDFVQHFSDLVTSEAGIAIHRVCISEADKRSNVAALFWRAGPDRIMRLLTTYLEEQVKRGKLDIPNIHFAADQLLFMVKSDVHMRGVLGLPCDDAVGQLPEYLDSCVEVFMRAYGVQP